MDSIQTALMLIGVGLPTVFLVLLLVIAVAKLLILTTNKYVPEHPPHQSVTEAAKPAIPTTKLSAIVAAVSILTQGQARIEKIEKQK